MTTIQINSDELVRKIEKVAQGLSRPRELTSAMAASLLTVTEDNFDTQGRPAWAGLNPNYAKRRKPGKSYLSPGGLRDSIQTHSNDNEGGITTNKEYAAIHQFGGEIKHGGGTRYQHNSGTRLAKFVRNSFIGPTTGVTGAHSINMSARPYLPMDENGNLQLEAENAIYDDVDYFYQKLFD